MARDLPQRHHRCTNAARPLRAGPNLLINVMRNLLVLTSLLVVSTLPNIIVAADAKIDFTRDVQPILTENCLACHGNDTKQVKGELRLDRADLAFKPAKSGDVAIIKGKPDESPLIKRICTTDEDDQMPPPKKAKRAITAKEIETLRKWIEQGADFKSHWAWTTPLRPTPPAATGNIRNPIDSFVLAKLAEEGMAPSPDAGKTALIRRVTLDATGLLPTPEETKQFVEDVAPDAYEKLVDRLLASPRYGEHRARYWLDYVRYADTHGLHFDNYRYRDYVINAFNENKPFDKFVREQVAGDLLPDAGLDAVVATGFIRCNVTTNEGGTIPEEIQAANVRDRVEAFGSVFMGVSVSCSECHDHKFDPMSMKDFYQLSAFFNNTAERSWDRNIKDPQPVVIVPEAQKRAALDEALRKKSTVQSQIRQRRDDASKLISDWLTSGSKPQAVPGEALQWRLRFDEASGNKIHSSVPGCERDVEATVAPLIWGEDTWLWPSARFEMNTKLSIPEAGDFERNQPFSAGGWVMVRAMPGSNGVPNGALFSRMDHENKDRGWSVEIEGSTTEGKFLVYMISEWPKNRIALKTKKSFPRGDWHHVLLTSDGSSKADGVKIFVDGVCEELTCEGDTLTETMKTTVPFHLGRRHDSHAMRETRFQDIRIYGRCLSVEEAGRMAFEDYASEIVKLPMEQWKTEQRWVLAETYFRRHDKVMTDLMAQLPALDSAIAKASEGGTPTLVARDQMRPAFADVLSRGAYNARRERVEPGFPHFLPGADRKQARDRRDLAEWVLAAENPLTARVVVNRMWQEVFGAGLVESSDDFGAAGQRPSHPELLDWLAVEFRESGWNMKEMYRRLLTSATYRQSAAATKEAVAKDPKNRLLARGPRYRMDGEMLRDIALQSGALLSAASGGPSVKPYAPGGLWEAVSMPESNTLHYQQEKGEALYRRSLYTFWKRFSPPPNMETFDAPNRELSCVRRTRTNTPLQALVTMNDPQYLEAARNLAERVLKNTPGDVAARLNKIGEIVLSRAFTDAERKALERTHGTFAAHFTKAPEEAKKLLGIGERAVDAALPANELAAWTLSASQVLNLDSALNK